MPLNKNQIDFVFIHKGNPIVGLIHKKNHSRQRSASDFMTGELVEYFHWAT